MLQFEAEDDGAPLVGFTDTLIISFIIAEKSWNLTFVGGEKTEESGVQSLQSYSTFLVGSKYFFESSLVVYSSIDIVIFIPVLLGNPDPQI